MRIDDKIEEIEEFLQQLSEVIPISLEDYKSDFRTKAICERYFEKIIEAVVDLAFLFIKNHNYDIPEGDKEAIQLLADKGIIDLKLSDRLQKAKSMRNIIAHEYGKIDDEQVFEAVSEEIDKDVKEFVERIKMLR